MKPSVGMTDRCLGFFGHLDNLTLHFFLSDLKSFPVVNKHCFV